VLDATLVRASDHATTGIEELSRGTAWTLLLFSGVEPDSPAEDAVALAEEIATRYGRRVVPYVVYAGAASPEGAAPGRILLDALHKAHERYGIADAAFYLLRPDTYVAARGRWAARDRLESYLREVFA
jgi:hypothetical protein